MKTIVYIFVLLGFYSQLYGQGTIIMSNVGRGAIMLNSVPVKAGEAVVYLANEEGELISTPIDILGAGVFTVGTHFLRDYSGTVTLKLGVVYTVIPDTVIFSEPFTVTLGGSGSPPKPPALLPAVSVNHQLDTDLPEPERPWPVQTDTWVTINRQESAKFFRADNLKIVSIKDGSIGIRFNGSLEVSESSNGPWRTLHK